MLSQIGPSKILQAHIAKLTNAAFTLNGFDDQERTLTFAKMDFQILKLKFHACSMKQAFLLLHKLNIARA